MADTQRLQRHGSWAVIPLAGLTLGLVLAGPASAAEPPTTSSSSSTSTSSSTTSTSTTSSSTTTTSTTLAPPPTTTPPVTSTLIPPLVDSGEPAEVGEAAQLRRDRETLPRTGPRTTATGATLPFTGNGTVAVFAAGLAALAIGALALWWGSRNRPEVDARGPEATG